MASIVGARCVAQDRPVGGLGIEVALSRKIPEISYFSDVRNDHSFLSWLADEQARFKRSGPRVSFVLYENERFGKPESWNGGSLVEFSPDDKRAVIAIDIKYLDAYAQSEQDRAELVWFMIILECLNVRHVGKYAAVDTDALNGKLSLREFVDKYVEIEIDVFLSAMKEHGRICNKLNASHGFTRLHFVEKMHGHYLSMSHDEIKKSFLTQRLLSTYEKNFHNLKRPDQGSATKSN